ncbi:hypothetical protein [Streptomyces odonnellii]|uniref:hypothetical protein n=1 Tax=Streptomyces odonnellii TaxID=1417980 RepID=UPI0012FEF5BC|nr:hypothetical protein [Streptomyces odonnellii]
MAGPHLVAFGISGSLFLLTLHRQFVPGYGPFAAAVAVLAGELSAVLLSRRAQRADSLPEAA